MSTTTDSAAAVPQDLVTVLVGTDHHHFDRLVNWSLELAAEGWARWFIQHGTSAWPDLCPPATRGASMVGIGELTQLLAQSSAVVTHAGPGLIIEAHRAGHRPVVVPRDPAQHEHVDGHQMRFAAHLGDSGRIRPAQTIDELRDQVRTAIDRGRGTPDPALMSQEVTARFAALVESAVQGRQHRHGR